jgi:uncharacterized protein YndB with AHSA1/START domain
MTEFTLNSIAIIFIAASPQRVWDALTDSEASAKYFMDNRVTVGPVGGDYIVSSNGQTSVSGKVLVRDAPHRLRVAWVLPTPAGMKFPNCEVEFLIETAETPAGGEVVKLTVSEFTDGLVPPQFQRAGRTGWALITSNLKSRLETGQPLPRVKLQAPA